MRWIKNDSGLFDGLDELYHHAKFGEDHTMRAGCWCENMVFVTMFFLSVMLRGQSAVR